jgi:phosphatidylserine/phosphatidylglycerophosphate/cardiolipin synthase-like enzyme
MTDTYTDTRDYGLVLTDPSIIAEWESVFEADITNAKNGTGTTPALPVPALLWSPVNSQSGLAALIASANSTVIATVESIDSSTEVFSALEAAAQRGVNVRLLTPECVENPNPLLDYNSLNTLVSHGASVRVMPNPSTAAAPYMHGKMMVVDSSAAFVGSENFTINSLEDARECGLIVTDAQTISTLGTTFAADWSASIAIPNPLPTNCPAD